MRGARAVLGAAIAITALPAPAHADPDAYLAGLAATVQRRLDELAAARAPKLVPPTPVAVRWKATRLGSIDLGAPLAALTAGDLDGDGLGELYAVTAREVVVIALRGFKPVELGRVAFAGPRAVPASRDVVGTAVIDGRELVAATSGWAHELRVTLAPGPTAQLGQPTSGGLRVCADERWQLAPGRNYFVAAGAYYGVRCRADLVDRDGAPLRVRAQLGLTGKLAISAERCTPAGACSPAASYEYGNAGTAFEIADVDRDGTPEVILASHVAPGDPDLVRVVSLGGDDKKPVFQKRFNGGVVGLAALATPASAPPLVVAAVRLAGATRIDLWRLD